MEETGVKSDTVHHSLPSCSESGASELPSSFVLWDPHCHCYWDCHPCKTRLLHSHPLDEFDSM